MKKYCVEVQASCTVKFMQYVIAESPDQARETVELTFKKLDSGMVRQADGELLDPERIAPFMPEYADEKYPAAVSPMYFEITEAPKADHDYQVEDIEVTEDEDL